MSAKLFPEPARVITAAVASTGISLADVNVFLNTIVLVGTAVYIWRKALRKTK